MRGLEEWLAKQDAPYFGLDRNVEPIRFIKPFCQSKLKIFWMNLKRFLKQRWNYYD